MPGAEPEVFTSDELRQVRHNPWLMGLAASPALLSVAALVGGIAGSPALFGFVFHPVIAALLLVFTVYKRRPRPVFTRAKVRADREGLTVDGTTLPRAALREGLVVPSKAGQKPHLEIRPKRLFSPAIRLEIEDRPQGRTLLRALGLDASQTVATFRALSMVVANRRFSFMAVGGFALVMILFVLSVITAIAVEVPGLIALGVIPLVLSYFAMIGAFLAPTKMSVGADGILITWLWWKRFIPFRELVTVVRFASKFGRSKREGLTLVRNDGEELRVAVSQHAEDVAIVEERIQEAVETFRRGDADDAASLIRRNGRDTRAWITALRSLGAGSNADLRTAPVPRERLFRIVEDPSAAPTERAAAAVALGVEIDADGQARLRAAAEATAAPKLRIAIEEAALPTGDDQALDEALAAVEAEGEREARRASS